MKKLTSFIIFSLLMVSLNVLAQAPQAIKYQAITRDISGSILANQDIKMRISILLNSPDGSSLYSETHTATTNAFGLVNLEIGNGTAMDGDFNDIDWSKGNFFVKIEVDENGGDNFQFLGSSQLLSVPYALYANSAGIRHMTDDQRDSIADPAEGMMIYNVNSQCLNVRRQGNWFELCGECVPQPTTPHAGQDDFGPVDTLIQLSANTPVKGSGSWVVISGNGGYFSDISNPNAIFHGFAGQVYQLGWRISTNCKTLTDTVNVSLNQEIVTGFNCGDSILHGGKFYHTIEIGNQCWMKENLDLGIMLTGSQDQTNNSIIEKYCYNNLPANCDIYGGLYQWNEMMNYENASGAKGICPDGMHIPTLAEWETLVSQNGGVMYAGGAKKKPGLQYWSDPNNGATNASGFSALGAGYRHINGTTLNLNANTSFWGSTVNGIDNGLYYFLRSVDAGITPNYFNKAYGFSVRCILD